MDNSSGYAGARDPGNVTTAIPNAQQTGSNPNLFERLFPTIGGIAGGIATAPLEALDAVSGVGGTALNAAGAAGGAGLGKALENKLTHQGGGNGVLTSALEGGIGQGVGAGVGSVLGKVLPSASTMLGKTAGDFLQGQAAPGTLGRTDATELAGLGINDLRKLPDIADQITGEDGALNQGVVKALIANGKPVNVDGLISVKNGGGLVNDLVDNETAIQPASGTKIINTVNKSVQNMLGGSSGMVGNQAADPLDVLNQSRVFSKLASTASQNALRSGNAEQAGVANVYRNLSSELESRLFGSGNTAVPLTDDIKSQIIDQLAPLKESSPSIYSKVVSQVTDAQNAQDLRPAQALWVRASQAAQKTAVAADKGAGTSATDIVKGTSPGALLLAGHPISAIGSIATALPAADRASAGILSKLSKTVGSKTAAKMVPLLSRATGVAAATLPNVGASPTDGSVIPGANGTLNTGATMPPTQSAGTNIFTALGNPTAPGNANASAEGLQALLGMFAPMLLNSAVENNANQAGQNIQKLNVASGLVGALPGEQAQAGGAQGPIGGLLSSLAARITGNQAGANYGAQQQQVAQALAGATGLPASSIQTPSITQGPQTSQDALANLWHILQAAGAAPTSAIPVQ